MSLLSPEMKINSSQVKNSSRIKNPILYKFVLKNLWWMLLVAIVTVATGWTRAVGASYVGKITDLIGSGTPSGLLALVSVGAAFMFMAYFTRWLGAVICLYLTEKLSLETRVNLISHLEKIPFANYEKYTAGHLQSVIRNDVNTASELLYNLFSRILNNVFLFIFSVYYMLVVNVQATVVVVAFSIGMGIINQSILKRLRKPQQEVRKSIGNLTNIVENTFLSMDTVKTFSTKDYILDFFKREKKIYNENGLKSEKIDAGRLTLYNLVNNLSIYLSLFYLGFMAINGKMSVGSVFMFIYLLKQIFVPVEVIFRWMSRIVTSNTAWLRVYEILDQPAETEDAVHECADVRELAISNINYSYDGKTKILDNLALDLSCDKLNALVGESGSGKSTLQKVILGLYHGPDSLYRINGEAAEIRSLKGIAAFAPSDNQLFNMSIYENISLGNDKITKEMCMDAAEKLGIADWINSLPEKLDTVISENAGNISGGQRQMISNMRAMLADNPVVIMDEPFSALDKDREASLLCMINELKNRKLFLLTSHRDSTIRNCDNVHIMNRII